MLEKIFHALLFHSLCSIFLRVRVHDKYLEVGKSEKFMTRDYEIKKNMAEKNVHEI